MKYKLINVILCFVIIICMSCTSNSSTINSEIVESVSSSLESNVESEENFEDCFFASPNGDGDGSYSNPTSLVNAMNNLSLKKRIYLFGGTYQLNKMIELKKDGSENQYIEIFSFKDEEVVLDFGKDYRKQQVITNEYNKSSNKGIIIRGSYYHIKGITITNCGSTGIHIYGSYNIVENCILAYNGNTGLNISGSASDSYDCWPSFNTIKNCTSYGNYDWNRNDGNQGEDADGFGCKLTSGPGNVFDGCIAYNNSDDGWDLFTKQKTGKIGSVTIKNSLTFKNGYSIDGTELKNGNGFKLGGRAIEVDHYVENCIAFFNKAHGFDDNSNPGTISLVNCTGFKNESKNFALGRFLEENNTYTSTWYEDDTLFGPIYNVPKSHNIIINCISYLGGVDDTYSGIAENTYFWKNSAKYIMFSLSTACNSKYLIGKEVESLMPFESIQFISNDIDSIHYDYRNEDNSINLNSFLKIKAEYKELGVGAVF